MITEPSTSSRAFLRKRDAIAAQLHAVVDRLPPRKREAAIEAATVPTVRYERYRRGGRTLVRKAREALASNENGARGRKGRAK